jgi:hypothetical protein
MTPTLRQVAVGVVCPGRAVVQLADCLCHLGPRDRRVVGRECLGPLGLKPQRRSRRFQPRDREGGGGDDEVIVVLPGHLPHEAADSNDSTDVHQRQNNRQRPVDERAVDHAVDVVEAVLEDRKRGGDRKGCWVAV